VPGAVLEALKSLEGEELDIGLVELDDKSLDELGEVALLLLVLP